MEISISVKEGNRLMGISIIARKMVNDNCTFQLQTQLCHFGCENANPLPMCLKAVSYSYFAYNQLFMQFIRRRSKGI